MFQKFLVIFITAIVLMSCRELVQEDFTDFTAVPTLNSFLVADSQLLVHVSMTRKLDTIPLTLVNDAVVSWFVNDSLAGELVPAGNGYYTGESIAIAGKVYRFKVSIPGFPEITAMDTIPEQVQLTSVEHIKEAGIDEEGHSFPAIRITFPVNPGRIQYFEVAIRMNDYKTRWRPAYFKDFTDPVLLAEGLPIAVFSTAHIKDENYTLKLDYTTGSFSGINGVMVPNLYPLVVEFKTISYAYYQYLRQLYLYETGRFPDFSFGSYHAFPLYSNISNGMGVVAGYSVFKSERITPEP